jgi:4-amino-4-deoxy-L-arabinose transferase-like glycosyltransferase
MRASLEASHSTNNLSPFTWFWRGMLLIALLLFALGATYQIQLPGLNYDEALDAVPAMNVALGQPVHALATIWLGGREWPLMVMPYIGAVTSWLLLAGFTLAGVSVTTLRLTTVIVGGLILLLSWGFLRDYLDERVASLAVLLLAVNPTYVFWSRMGGWVAQPMLPIFILALWCLFRWYRSRRAGYLIGAALCLGFGLSTKLLFVWVWTALATAWLLLSPWLEQRGGLKRWLWPLRGLNVRTLTLVIAAAMLGSGVVIWYNLQGAGTFHFITDHILRGSAGGMALTDVITTIAFSAAHDLRTLLDGSWFTTMIGGPYHNLLAVPVFLASLVIVCVLALTHRLKYSAKRLALLALFMVCFVLQGSAASISRGANHLILVWPIPQTFVAVALVSLADLATETMPARRQVWVVSFGLLALVFAGGEVLTTYRYHSTLAQSRGSGHFSDAIYELAQDLEQPGTPRVVALDWGFLRNLQLLSENRINVVERFTYASPPGEEFAAYLEDLMRKPDDLYLFHSLKYTAFLGHWEAFDRAAYRHGLTPVPVKIYRQRDGQPVYLLYRLEPSPALQALPPGAQKLEVHFGNAISLLGYDALTTTVQPGDLLQATVYWQAKEPQARSYKVFGHLLDEKGQQWAIHDSVPRDWSHPTTQWQAGEIVADRLWLPIKPDTPPGTYHLFLGMYDETTGQRLPITRGDEPQGDTLELMTVQVRQ